MWRKIWQTVLGIAAWLGLTEFARELSKTALYEWVLDQAKALYAERQAEVIALAATYAVPLVGSGIIIACVAFAAYRHGRAKSVAHNNSPLEIAADAVSPISQKPKIVYRNDSPITRGGDLIWFNASAEFDKTKEESETSMFYISNAYLSNDSEAP